MNHSRQGCKRLCWSPACALPPARSLVPHSVLPASSAHAAQLLSLAKTSHPKPLLPQLRHLLSCYFPSPWLIPIFHVNCCPEKHFWVVLRPLGASPSQATAFRFLQLLFISKAVNSAFLFLFSFSFFLWSFLFYGNQMTARTTDEIKLSNTQIHYAGFLPMFSISEIGQ